MRKEAKTRSFEPELYVFTATAKSMKARAVIRVELRVAYSLSEWLVGGKSDIVPLLPLYFHGN